MALAGEFVECGVSTGMFSLTLCDYVRINATNKRLFLFDTFDGIPEAQMPAAEKPHRTTHHNAHYVGNLARAKSNFAPYPLLRGPSIKVSRA